MSNTIIATITGVSLVIAERNDMGLICETIATECRPATLAEADRALAFHSLGRVGDWDLDTNGGVAATVVPVDNRFNGTVAARLDQAVGTTHGAFDRDHAENVESGDLVSDLEMTEVYVVGGCSTDGDTKIHMIREGGTWETRFTGHFHPRQLIMRARRQA